MNVQQCKPLLSAWPFAAESGSQIRQFRAVPCLHVHQSDVMVLFMVSTRPVVCCLAGRPTAAQLMEHSWVQQRAPSNCSAAEGKQDATAVAVAATAGEQIAFVSWLYISTAVLFSPTPALACRHDVDTSRGLRLQIGGPFLSDSNLLHQVLTPLLLPMPSFCAGDAAAPA